MARNRVVCCVGLISGLLMASLPALASTTKPVVKAVAQVSKGGSIIKASDNVTGAKRLGQGLYEVAFSIKIDQCAWLSSLVYPGTPDGGGTQVGHVKGNSKILVRTGSGGGGPFDSEFH